MILRLESMQFNAWQASCEATVGNVGDVVYHDLDAHHRGWFTMELFVMELVV